MVYKISVSEVGILGLIADLAKFHAAVLSVTQCNIAMNWLQVVKMCFPASFNFGESLGQYKQVNCKEMFGFVATGRAAQEETMPRKIKCKLTDN